MVFVETRSFEFLQFEGQKMYLAEVFWSRFKTEYLSQLQLRQKWNYQRRNLVVGDIVIIRDDTICRDSWPLARVVEVFPSKDGLVRSCKLRVGNSRLDNKGKQIGMVSYLTRPVNKIVLLLHNETEINE